MLELLTPCCKYALPLLIHSNTDYYSNNKWQVMCYFEITHIMVHIMSSETRAMCCFTLTNARKCLHLWIKYSPRILTCKCALCKSIRVWPHHRHPKPLLAPAWITALPSVRLDASFWKESVDFVQSCKLVVPLPWSIWGSGWGSSPRCCSLEVQSEAYWVQ